MTSDGLAFFVWPLVLIFVGVGLLTLHTPPSTNDYSTHAHRQLIGWIGLILPIALPGIARLRPIRELQWSELLSISSYYYTGAIALFVGLRVELNSLVSRCKYFQQVWKYPFHSIGNFRRDYL